MLDINLDGNEPDPNQGTISLYPQIVQTAYPEAYADTKAARYNVALGPASPGVDTLKADVSTGNAQDWDQTLANMSDQKNDETRKNIIQSWAANRNPFTPPSELEQATVEGLAHPDYPKADPSTALSETYSNKYVDLINSIQPNQAYKDAADEHPDTALNSVDKAQWATQRTLEAQDLYQQIAKRREKEGLSVTIGSFLEGMLPGVTNLLTRDAAKAPFSPLLGGDNWSENISYLYSLPPEQFAVKAKEAIEGVEKNNPMMAQQFAAALLSFSTSDREGGQLTDIADALTVGSSVAKTASELAKMGSAAGAATRGAGVGATAEEAVAAGAVTQDARKPGGQTNPLVPALPSPMELASRGDQTGPLANNNIRPGPRPVDLANQGDQTRGPVVNTNTPPSTPPAPQRPSDASLAAQRQLQPGGSPAVQDLSANNNYVGPASRNPEAQAIREDLARTPSAPTDARGVNSQLDGIATGEGPKVPPANVNLHQGLNKVIAAVVHDPNDIPKIAGEVGMNDVAARAKAIQDIGSGDPTGLMKLEGDLAQALPSDRMQLINSLEDRLPSGTSPARGFAEKQDLSTAAKNKISEVTLRLNAIDRASGNDLINKVVRVDRLEPHQLQVAAEEAFSKVKDIFRGSSHHILDWQTHHADTDKLTNLYRITTRFGQRDGTLFKTREAAVDFVRSMIQPKTNDFEIHGDGVGGYYAQVTRNVSEVDGVRDHAIPVGYQTPQSVSTRLLQGLKSADYLLPKGNVNARGRVVHSQEYMGHMLQQMYKDSIGPLSKSERQGVENVLSSNRVNNVWQRTGAEFEAEYLARNGHLPTQAQVKAYHAVVELSDLDYAVRDFDLVTQLSRLGGEKFGFQGLEGGSFIGKQVDHIPYELKDPFTVQIVDGEAAGKEFYSGGVFFEKQRAQINEALDQGASILLDPSKAKYYIVKSFKRDRVPLGQLGYIEGGHREYRFEHFVKQGNVENLPQGINDKPIRRYRGDVSLASAPTAKHASDIAKLLNEGREMLLRNDPKVGAFWSKKLDSFMTLPEFRQALGRGDIKLDVPFVATQKGQRTIDVSSWSKSIPHFMDATTNEHNIFSSVGGRFMGEQSEKILDVLKTEGNRIVKTSHDALLNPWDTLRTATQNLLDTRVANDYKAKVGSDWLQEFGHLLDEDPNKLRSNPLAALNNPKYKTGGNPTQIAASEAVRTRTLMLNNYQTSWDKLVTSYKSKLLDASYDKLGVNGRDFVDDSLLPVITHPDQYLRAMAYHMRMGFFNPKQFIVQASEVTKIAMVSPVHGPQAMRQLLGIGWALATDNDAVLRGIANRFGSIMGVDKENWLKSVDAFKRSGFSIVGHDQGFLDTVSASGPTGVAGKIGSAMTAPYRGGELTARILAWSTAWREWHAANPGKTINRYGETQVLQRATDLTNNMGRQSNAIWQRGLAAVVGQFFGYHAHFAEQLWDGGLLGNGTKLTRGEKWRTIIGMAALWGVPMAATGVIPGIPFKQALKDHMASSGEDFDDKAVDPFIDGLIPLAVAAMLGEKYDFSNSYGPSGIPSFYELINGDKQWYDILAGASGGILASVLPKMFGGTAQVISDVLDLSKDQGSFKVLGSDLVNIFSDIATVDSAQRLWQIANTHNWISKSGSLLANDATVQDALMSAMMGVTPERISNAYEKLAASGRVQEWQKEGQKQIREAISIGSRAANEGDIQAMQQMYKRAKAIAVANGLTPEQFVQAVNQGWTNTPITQRGDESYNKFKNTNIDNRMQGE